MWYLIWILFVNKLTNFMWIIVDTSTLETWLRYKYLTLLETVPGDIMYSNSLLNSIIINPYFSELQLIQKYLKESNFHTSFPDCIFKIWTWNTKSARHILIWCMCVRASYMKLTRATHLMQQFIYYYKQQELFIIINKLLHQVGISRQCHMYHTKKGID